MANVRMPIERFNPHSLADQDLHDLAVGYERPMETLLTAVEEAILGQSAVPPHRHRHCLLVAPRGYGKSYLMRLLVMSLADRPGVIPVVLPEENYSVRLPHHLLRKIRYKLAPNVDFGIKPRLDFTESEMCSTMAGARALWNEELAACRSALALAVATRDGNRVANDLAAHLLVVTLENLEMHARRLFRPGSLGHTLFRELLADPQSRMLFITSSSRPLERRSLVGLLGEPIEMTLGQWSFDICLRYFDKLSERMRGTNLTAGQKARARAIYDYIGGAPRLAATVGLWLLEGETVDAITLLHAMATDLTAYYKERYERLSWRAQQVFEALVLMGESSSATAVARHLGVKPNSITAPFRELQAELLVDGIQSKHSSAVRLEIRDRMFVYWFRQREIDHQIGEPQLGLLIEALFVYYSQDEIAGMAKRAAEVGYITSSRRIAEFARMALASESESYIYRTQGFVSVLRMFADRLPIHLIRSAKQQIRNLGAGMDQAVLEHAMGWVGNPDPLVRIFAEALLAADDCAAKRYTSAHARLRALLNQDVESDERALLLEELAQVEFQRSGTSDSTIPIASELEAMDFEKLSPAVAVAAESMLVFRDIECKLLKSAIRRAQQAILQARRGRFADSMVLLQRYLGWALREVGRIPEAIVAFQISAEVAREQELPRSEILALETLGWTQIQMGDGLAAVSSAERALQLARPFKSIKLEIQLHFLLCQAHSEAAVGDSKTMQLEASIDTADQMLTRLTQKERETEGAELLYQKAISLRGLRRFEQSNEVATEIFNSLEDADLRVRAATLQVNNFCDIGSRESARELIKEITSSIADGVRLSTSISFCDQSQWVAGQCSWTELFAPLLDWLVDRLVSSQADSSTAKVNEIDESALNNYLSNLAIYLRRISFPSDEAGLLAEIKLRADIGDALGRWPSNLRVDAPWAVRYQNLCSLAKDYGKRRSVLANLQAQVARGGDASFQWHAPVAGRARELAGAAALEALAVFTSAEWMLSAMPPLLGVREIVDLPFQPGVRVIEIAFVPEAGRIGAARALCWEKDGERKAYLLDGNNEPVYLMVEEVGINLSTEENARSYAQFFFDLVVGQLGSFLIVENPGDLEIDGDISQARRKTIAAAVRPSAAALGEDGAWIFDATVLFTPSGNPAALFYTRIKLNPTGVMEFQDDEELAIESIPVLRRRYRKDGIYETGLHQPSAAQLQRLPEVDWKVARKILKTDQLRRVREIAANILRDSDGERTRLAELATQAIRRLRAEEVEGSQAPGVLMIALAAASGQVEMIELLAETAAIEFMNSPSSPEPLLNAAAAYLAKERDSAALEELQPDLANVVRAWFGGNARTTFNEKANRKRRARKG